MRQRNLKGSALLFLFLLSLFSSVWVGSAEAVTVRTYGYNEPTKVVFNRSNYSQVLEAEDLVRQYRYSGSVMVAPSPWSYMVWMVSLGARLYADFSVPADTVAVQFALSDSNDGVANIYVDGQRYVSLNTRNQINWYVEISDLPTAQHHVVIETAYNANYYVDLHIDAIAVRTGNKPPIPEAGPNQTVNEYSAVTLDGSASKDPEGKPLTYQWTQLAGSPVVLKLDDPSHPTFTAPAVSVGGETLTFKLVVSDGTLSAADTVDVNVKNVNHAPIADAGDDTKVAENSTVTLNGAHSYDPDLDQLTYLWLQTGGPSVGISDSASATPVFPAPAVGVEGANLTFQLTVTDGIDSASDTVNVYVENVNHAPTANAGINQTRNEGSTVTLDASSSSDIDGDALTFTWKQLQGTPVALSDANAKSPSFTAPLVGPERATLVFQLVVNDGFVDSALAEVAITVLDINSPPSCGNAGANPSVLWPPNHRLVPVEITGVKDPDSDLMTITLLGVTQDEPISGLGDGDTSPDAIIEGNKLLLRAERAGAGNGRNYRITFRADDSFGESCTGSVTVSVPHARNGISIEDSQTYDSLAP